LRRLAAWAALWSCVAVGPAWAQSAEEVRQEARRHYEAGAAAFEAQDYATALAEMEASYALFPSLRTLYSIALCRHGLLDYPGALVAFEQYLREGGADVPAALREEAESLMAAMRRDMARIDVRVDVEAADVLVDGTLRGTTPLAVPIDVGPGVHLIEVRSDGFESAVHRVTLAAGRTEVWTPTLVRRPEAAAVLRIETGDVPARAWVDGNPAGTTPVEVDVEPGRHEVRVEADGFEPSRGTGSVAAGATATVAFRLVPIERSGGPVVAVDGPGGPDGPVSGDGTIEEEDSLWWVWTIVGVVAAGAIAAGVVLGLPDDDVTWDMRGRVP
jgi:hypothetical protein